jgi:hypothetical protein
MEYQAEVRGRKGQKNRPYGLAVHTVLGVRRTACTVMYVYVLHTL